MCMCIEFVIQHLKPKECACIFSCWGGTNSQTYFDVTDVIALQHKFLVWPCLKILAVKEIELTTCLKSLVRLIEKVPVHNFWTTEHDLKLLGDISWPVSNYLYDVSFWNKQVFGVNSFCRHATTTKSGPKLTM